LHRTNQRSQLDVAALATEYEVAVVAAVVPGSREAAEEKVAGKVGVAVGFVEVVEKVVEVKKVVEVAMVVVVVAPARVALARATVARARVRVVAVVAAAAVEVKVQSVVTA
jgi:hypothetical protein